MFIKKEKREQELRVTPKKKTEGNNNTLKEFFTEISKRSIMAD